MCTEVNGASFERGGVWAMDILCARAAGSRPYEEGACSAAELSTSGGMPGAARLRDVKRRRVIRAQNGLYAKEF